MKTAKKNDNSDNTSTQKSKTPVATLIVALALIIFIFQEILFRLIFPVPEITNFNRIKYSPLFFSKAGEDMKFLMNAAFIWASDPDNAQSVINTNLYGFRDKNFSADPNPDVPRVAFIGDSFVEGYLADADQSIPAVFKQEAESHGKDIETLNLGIGGNELYSYCRELCDIVPTLKPDHVIIVLHANDLPPQTYNPAIFEKPITPEYSHWWIPRFVYVLKNAMAGKTVAKSWESKPFTYFAPVPAPSNPWSNTEKSSRYEKFVSPKVAEAMKKGRFNPFSVDEYSKFKEHLPETLKISDYLNGIQNFMAQYRKKIYLAYVPSRNQVSNYYLQFQKEFSSDTNLIPLTGPEYQVHAKTLKETCKGLGIPFYDFTEVIKKEEDSGNHIYWNYDEHMRPKGYELLGKTLYDWWKTARKQ